MDSTSLLTTGLSQDNLAFMSHGPFLSQGHEVFMYQVDVNPENEFMRSKVTKQKIHELLNKPELYTTYDDFMSENNEEEIGYAKPIYKSFIMKDEEFCKFYTKMRVLIDRYIVQNKAEIINYNKDNFMSVYYVNYVEDGYWHRVVTYTIDITQINKSFIEKYNNITMNEQLYKNTYDYSFILMLREIMARHNKIYNNLINSSIDENVTIKEKIFNNCAQYMNQLLIEQPTYLNTKLHVYQKANIRWMIETESNPKKFNLSESPTININMKYHYNINTNKFVDNCDKSSVKEIYLNGGCISDDVGLGKTIQSITLYLENAAPTLVIVPEHLLQHWKNEIKKHLNFELSYQVYENGQLINSNLVFATHEQLLESSELTKYVWYRVMVDEYHELLTKDIKILNNLYQINTHNRWAVTATPFTDFRIIHSLLQFVCKHKFKDTRIGKFKDYLDYFALFFRRNTKESIKQELVMPHITNNKYYIDFSALEKSYYIGTMISESETNEGKLKLRQFCINPNISEDVNTEEEYITIEDLQPKIISYYNENIDKHKKDLYEIFDKYRKNWNSKFEDDNIIIDEQSFFKNYNYKCYLKYFLTLPLENTIKNEYEKLEKQIELYNASIERIMTTAEKVKSTIQTSENEMSDDEDDDDEHICGVCLSSLKDIDNDMTMLTCGHIYCLDCFKTIQHVGRSGGKCQQCQVSLNNLKIFNIVKKNMKRTEFRDLINKYGTKITLLLKLFAEEEVYKRKTIIYCSWDKCLSFLNTVMSEFGHTTVYPNRTNLYNEINRFENDESCKVLLLSSDFNASGLNIVSAKNIILLNPIDGNYSYRKQITNQIIGRVHRIGQTSDVLFSEIIIKDTVESKLDTENKIIDVYNETTMTKELLLPMEKNEIMIDGI